MTRPHLQHPSPDGWKVCIALEELGLANEIVPGDITQDKQQKQALLGISPNNRIQALVGWKEDEEFVRNFESGAILRFDRTFGLAMGFVPFALALFAGALETS